MRFSVNINRLYKFPNVESSIWLQGKSQKIYLKHTYHFLRHNVSIILSYVLLIF